MKRIRTYNGQSIWDLAIQEYGDPSFAGQIMLDNPGKIDFNSSIAPGTELLIDESKITEPEQHRMIEFFSKKNYKPATAVEVEAEGSHEDSLLTEDGDYLLQESGGTILLE